MNQWIEVLQILDGCSRTTFSQLMAKFRRPLKGPSSLTVPLNNSFRGQATDLPANDPRVQRTVKGFEPEQISVSLSSTHDSVWISWITGFFFRILI